LQGPRALRELAQIVVYSTKCMGKGKSLYVPQQLIAKIEQRGGAAKLKQCSEGNKPGAAVARLHPVLGQGNFGATANLAESNGG
jgi:hypothetical protein